MVHIIIIIRLLLIGFIAFCLLSHILVYIMLSVILFNSAACIDLACFHQLACDMIYIYSVPNVYPEGF